MKTKCEFQSTGDDGTFYMPIKDYKTYFEETTICKVWDSYVSQTIKITPIEEGNWVKFSIDSSEEGFVSVI